MALSKEQRIEMWERIRDLESRGKSLEAGRVREALAAGIFDLDKEPEPEPAPEAPKRNASKAQWIDFALEVSEIDQEVLEGASRDDVIGMLEANGLIERLVVEEDEADEDED